jgi:type II secretory ATPase GspE/PulE/Tfp pilus assembly ATPase PilB-like protein
MAVRRWLGDALLNAGLVTKAQLDEALAVQAKSGDKIGTVLVDLGIITQNDLQKTLCTAAGIPFESELQPEADAVALLSRELANTHTAVPVKLDGRHVILAMADPFDLLAMRALTRAIGKSVRVVGSPREVVLRSIDIAYSANAAAQGAMVASGGATAPMPAAAPRLGISRGDTSGGAGRAVSRPGWPQTGPWRVGDDPNSAATLVNDLIRRGVEMSATDIHIEPREGGLHVRYRVDGLLMDGQVFPKAAQAAIISRIKILSTLDIADARLPQDGRTQLQVGGRMVDLRVSTYPTLHGEDIVLRVLDRGNVALDLETLGIETDDLILLRNVLQRPHGLIPVTGPTGSGKTTTLYAALSELSTGDRAILTLEDPIEYELPGVRQSQVNVRAGLTFATGLRSILRHDPDVILVGEIRDQETAQIAMSAALTGHLVLTTLHTTTAAGTIPRLLDMGVEPFVIASAVSTFVSQRLVRVLCSQCKTQVEMQPAVRKRFGLEGATLYAPKGCAACRGTGFRGRVAMVEILPMTPEVMQAIYDRTSPEQIHKESGRPTLFEDGIKKVQAGLTTLDEILRITT